MTWSWLDLWWPYLGLGSAGLIAILLSTHLLAVTSPRWRDPTWLAWAGLATYQVHQFEEYGIDAMGTQHAFPGELCATLGYIPITTCPVPAGFYLAVNLGAVWAAGLIGALLARRWPAVGLSLYGVIFINALVHIAASITHGRYGAGLVTAVLLFIPLSVWVARSVFVPRAAGRRGLGIVPMLLIVAGGILQHVVLLGSVAAFTQHLINETALIAIQVVNTVTTLAILAVWQMAQRRDGRGPG